MSKLFNRIKENIHKKYSILCPKCKNELIWGRRSNEIDQLKCRKCEIFYDMDRETKKLSISNKDTIISLNDIMRSHGLDTDVFLTPTSIWYKPRWVRYIEKILGID